MGKEGNPGGGDYPKLVRDKIPAIIQRDGKTPVFHQADDKEYYFALRDKLNEEVAELLGAQTRGAFIEEIADVMDVLDAMMSLSRGRDRITFAEVENVRHLKQTKRGKFTRRTILDRVEEK
jgi:predicted house-cleaning noncanonical NTP pyrophosphatase (MazG superfamily)